MDVPNYVAFKKGHKINNANNDTLVKYDEGMINFILSMLLLILPEQVEGSVVINRIINKSCK